MIGESVDKFETRHLVGLWGPVGQQGASIIDARMHHADYAMYVRCVSCRSHVY